MGAVDRRGPARQPLRRLQIPEHRTGFWDDVDAGLQAEAQPVPPGPVPAADARPSAGPAPPSARARRAFSLSAAAVLLAVVVAAVGLEDAGGGRDIGTAIGEGPPDTTQDEGGPAGARAAALDWIDVLATGDMLGAWDRLSPASQAAWESFEAFEAARGSFAEGLAQWASAEGLHAAATTVRTAPGDPLHVVTFTGRRRLQGTPVDDAYAVVVRETSSEHYELDPFTPHGTIGLQFVRPDIGGQPARWSADDPVVIAVPDAQADATLVVDGASDPVRPAATGRATTEGVELSYRPDGGWPPGRHVVTAFALYADGTPAATAVVFDVG